MSTLSNILNTGGRALQVQELAMQVLGHNIANVNTEGFSRRRIDFSTSPPGGIGQYHVGAGVDVDWVGRIRDRMLDVQIRESNTQVSYWNRRNESLDNIEGVLNGLGDVNIDSRLQQFWSAWHDLANDPENESARMQLLQRSQSLTSNVRRTHGELLAQLRAANEQIVQEVNRVNQLTSQIAAINIEISNAEMSGNEASDLRDQRDLLLENLSGIIQITAEEGSNGGVNVYSNGRILVQIDQSVEITVSALQGDSTRHPAIHYSGGQEMEISNGSLKALLDLRDSDIMRSLEDLDTFATAISTRINDVHRTGFGMDDTSGQNFFADDITGAADFRVNSLIVDNAFRIATAGVPGASGDNSIALEIAAVQYEKLLNNGRNTLDEFNRNISLRVGSSKSFVQSQLDVEDAARESLLNRRDSISGVSIDEEMTRMIQVQKAYQAVAQVVSTADEMINTLLGMKT